MDTQVSLNKMVNVKGQFHRSVQLKADWTGDHSLSEYILTPNGKNLAVQICEGAFSDRGPRAWSIIGPYGTGKSAFALFMTDVLCGQTPRHPEAKDLRKRFNNQGNPFFPVLITGQRASLSKELLLGLADNINLISPSFSEEIVRIAKKTVISNLDVLNAYQQASHIIESSGFGGMLVILDEFGKFLEYASQRPDTEDLFILQGLAEWAERSSPSTVFITILHTAFAEYLHSLDRSRQLEWQKVQGRFTSIPFLEPPEQLVRLVGTAIQKTFEFDIKEKYLYFLREAIGSEGFREVRKRLDLESLLYACIPLDPCTALILPSLFRSKLSQNERSLFAFLTSRESYGFQDFLSRSGDLRQLPLYHLDNLYDYVLNALGSSVYLGDRAHRWAGIETALQRVNADWPYLAKSIVKAVGLLGLYGPSVGLKASPETLFYAFSKAPEINEAIEKLKKASIIVFRKHEGAYGLWEGSDVDLEQEYESAKNRIGAGNIADRLKSLVTLRPVVARSHYIRTGTLRYFAVDVIEGNINSLRDNLEKKLYPADGKITYVVTTNGSDRQNLLDQARTLTSNPQNRLDQLRIFAFPHPMAGLENAVQEVETWNWIRDNVKALQGDPAASQEVRSQIIFARERLSQLAGQILRLGGHKFDPSASEWVQNGQIVNIQSDLEFQRWLSNQLDLVFDRAPIIKNELINRDELSSSAAAARRSLLAAMIDHEEQENLGFQGNPAEYTMYRALLQNGGFHQKQGERYIFCHPNNEWHTVSTTLLTFLEETINGRRSLEDLFSTLRQPPLGLKFGPMPVLLCALLLSERDKVALYENGIFVHDLRIEVFERLVRAPESFAIQQHRFDDDARVTIDGLLSALSNLGLLRSTENYENLTLLKVVKPLILFAAKLPTFTKKTRRLEPQETIAVRDTLLRASDPYSLVLTDLPKVFGIQLNSTENVQSYLDRIQICLGSLSHAYPNLLDEIEQQTKQAFNLDSSTNDDRLNLCKRAKPLVGFTVDRNLSLFIREASRLDVDARDWREIVGRAVNQGIPPEQWTDIQLVDFQVRIVQIANDFVRLEELVSAQKGQGSSKILRIGMLDSGLEQERAVISVSEEAQLQVNELAEAITELINTNLNGSQKAKHIKIAALAQVVVELIKGQS